MCNRVMNKEIQTLTDHEIFESGTAGHCLLPNSSMSNEQPKSNPSHITLPDSHTIASTHIFLLNIPKLHVTVQIAHIVPDLVHSSPISIKQFCHAGYRGEYDASNCYVYFNSMIILWGHEMKRQNNRHYSLKPQAANDTKISKLQMTGHSIIDTITLIAPQSRNFNKFGYISTIEHVSTKHDLIKFTISVYSCHPHQCGSQPLHWPLQWMTRSYSHIHQTTHPYIKRQQSKDTPSNHHRTCYPQPNPPCKENLCSYTPITMETNQTLPTQYIVVLPLQIQRIKQSTLIWLKNFHVCFLKVTITYLLHATTTLVQSLFVHYQTERHPP